MKAIALFLCLAVPCFAQEADGGTLVVEIDAGVPFVGPEFPRDAPTSSTQLVVLSAEQAKVTRDRILSCEAERDVYRKGPLVSPLAVVMIAAAAAIVSGVVVAGVLTLPAAK